MSTFSNEDLLKLPIRPLEVQPGDVVRGNTDVADFRRFAVGGGTTPTIRMVDGALIANDGTVDRVLVGRLEGKF